MVPRGPPKVGDHVVELGTGHERVALLGKGPAAPMVSRGKPKVGDLEVVRGMGHVALLGTGHVVAMHDVGS